MRDIYKTILKNCNSSLDVNYITTMSDELYEYTDSFLKLVESSDYNTLFKNVIEPSRIIHYSVNEMILAFLSNKKHNSILSFQDYSPNDCLAIAFSLYIVYKACINNLIPYCLYSESGFSKLETDVQNLLKLPIYRNVDYLSRKLVLLTENDYPNSLHIPKEIELLH